MAERVKYNAYTQQQVSPYFWRIYDQQKIELYNKKDGGLPAFE